MLLSTHDLGCYSSCQAHGNNRPQDDGRQAVEPKPGRRQGVQAGRNEQEKLNAIFSGLFVTLAKAEFSNSQNANIQKWSAYVKGSANRQDFLERALEWVSKGDIGGYMSQHRNDNNINE